MTFFVNQELLSCGLLLYYFFSKDGKEVYYKTLLGQIVKSSFKKDEIMRVLELGNWKQVTEEELVLII